MRSTSLNHSRSLRYPDIVLGVLTGIFVLALTEEASACKTARSHQGHSVERQVAPNDTAGKYLNDQACAKHKRAGGQTVTGETSEQQRAERKNKDSLKLLDRAFLSKTRC